MYSRLTPEQKNIAKAAILTSRARNEFPSIIQALELSPPAQTVPQNRQPTVDEVLFRIEQAIDQEDMTTINQLSESGIFNRPDLLAPIFQRSLLRKIRPKYEGAKADTADWVRWLVKNGA